MPDFPRGEWKKGQPEPDVTKLTARPVQSGSSWLIVASISDICWSWLKQTWIDKGLRRVFLEPVTVVMGSSLKQTWIDKGLRQAGYLDWLGHHIVLNWNRPELIRDYDICNNAWVKLFSSALKQTWIDKGLRRIGQLGSNTSYSGRDWNRPELIRDYDRVERYRQYFDLYVALKQTWIDKGLRRVVIADHCVHPLRVYWNRPELIRDYDSE